MPLFVKYLPGSLLKLTRNLGVLSLYFGSVMLVISVSLFRQYRLAAYRHILDWALREETLGPNNRMCLPACVVLAVRKKYPSPFYTGYKEIETAMDL